MKYNVSEYWDEVTYIILLQFTALMGCVKCLTGS